MNAIGVSCPEFGKTPFPEALENISKEFRHWEIFSELDHYAPLVSLEHASLIRDSDLTFSVHTGIADINVASNNERLREAAVANIVAEMKAANDLDLDTVTVHPGIINLAVKGVRERSIAQAKISMKEIEHYSVEYGLYACIENMPNFPVMLGIQADELKEIIDGTDLSVCFDIGHAALLAQDVRSAINSLSGLLAVTHLHDNNGVRDLHALPFSIIPNWGRASCVDWDGFIQGMRDIAYDGTLNFETAGIMLGLPEELREGALNYTASAGKYLKEKIEYKGED